jgi:hypothetical protein
MLRPSRSTPITLLRSLAGAVVGAIVGYFAFAWALRFGVMILALPGALVGVGCGLATGTRSLAAGMLAGVVALALSIVITWKFNPFRADDSLGYLLWHLHEASTQTLIMIGLGTLAGFWFGWHRSQPISAGTEETA